MPPRRKPKPIITPEIIEKKQKEIKNIELPVEHVILSRRNIDIKYIIHISDIHITKNIDRQEEYRCQFNKLYAQVKRFSETAHTIVLLTGDILHEKNSFTSQQIKILKDFIINLCEYTDVISIIGNHDINMNVSTDIDAISANMENIITKNKFYLLLHDKLYEYENLLFGVTTLFSTKVTPCEIKTDKLKIGLYHGIVEGMKNGSNYYLFKDCFKVEEFTKYYDMVALGDIHKPGFINENKTAFYAGSLIQQNFGEQTEHGYMLIDVEHRITSFNIIDNDYGFVKLTMDNGVIVDDIKIPKYPHIQLLYKNTSIEQVNKLAVELKTQYNAMSLSIDKIKEKTEDNLVINIGSKDTKIQEIKDDETTKRVIIDYIKMHEQITEEKVMDLSKILDTLINKITANKSKNKNKYVSLKNIKLKKVEFNNIMCYGENNIIDFEKIKGIRSVIGPSGVGKSTIIDVIIYGIFGKTLRGNISDMVNKRKPSGKIQIELTINEEDYVIIRSLIFRTNGKHTATPDVKVYRNGVNISRESVPETNEMIEKDIIDHEEFMKTCILLQSNSNIFLNTDVKAIKRQICNYIKLDIFSDIQEQSQASIKQINTIITKELGYSPKKTEDGKKLRGTKKEPYDYKKKLTEIKTLLEEKKQEHTTLKEQYEKLNNDINDKKQMMKHIDIEQKELENIKKYVSRYNILTTEITNINKLLQGKQNEITDKTKYNKDIEKKLNKLNQEGKKYKNIIEEKNKYEQTYEDKLNEYDNKKTELLKQLIHIKNEEDITQLSKLKTKIKSLNKKIYKLNDDITKEIYNECVERKEQYNELENNINKLTERLKKLDTHEYDPECKYCMSYNITIDKISYNDELTQNMKIKNKLMKRMKNDKKIMNTYILEEEHKNSNREIETEINELTNTYNCIEQYINDININDKINNELETLNKKINTMKKTKYEKYDQYIIYKKDYDETYNQHKINTYELKNIDLEIKNMSMQLKEYMNEIKLINYGEDKIKRYETNCIKYNQLKDELTTQIDICNTIQNDIHIIEKILIKLQINEGIEQSKYEKIIEQLKEIEIYQLLVDNLGGGGLVTQILQDNIIPKIEEITNNIMNGISNFTIKLKLVNKQDGIEILKVYNDGLTVTTHTLSGGEQLLVNIALLLSMTHINTNICTNFLFFDESFVYSDNKVINNLQQIFNYINEKYENVLIISHNPDIIKQFSNVIQITNDGTFSNVFYT